MDMLRSIVIILGICALYLDLFTTKVDNHPLMTGFILGVVILTGIEHGRTIFHVYKEPRDISINRRHSDK